MDNKWVSISEFFRPLSFLRVFPKMSRPKPDFSWEPWFMSPKRNLAWETGITAPKRNLAWGTWFLATEKNYKGKFVLGHKIFGNPRWNLKRPKKFGNGNPFIIHKALLVLFLFCFVLFICPWLSQCVFLFCCYFFLIGLFLIFLYVFFSFPVC